MVNTDTQNTTNNNSPIFSQPTDQGALTLARSIALAESSKNGGTTPNYTATGDAGSSYGAYQWNNGKQPLQPGQLPVNFTNAAKQYGLDPTDFSPVNQDKVAYAQVKTLKDQGLSPEQIAASWNAGMGHVNDWQNHVGDTVINGQVIHYDTPGYVNKVQGFYQKLAGGNQQTPDNGLTTSIPTPEPAPSVGGFGENVIKSGANFVENVGNALLHPIDTLQNIGGAAVGGIQELGGQTNDNTQKWDALKNFFIQRYKSPDAIAHTLYTDPVGFAADLSAVLGVGGAAVGAASKGAELAGLGTAARVGTEVAPAVEATGVAGGLGEAAGALGKAAEITNPLTPVIKGVGGLINKSTNISDIIKNPQDYTPENIANSSAAKIGEDAQAAFDAQRAALSETGAAYQPMRETPIAVPTTPAFLDNTLRDALKLSVEDGIIKATGDSLIRNSADISKLQQVYNTYKPYFLSDTMDSNRFLNLRSDLGNLAYNDLGIKNTSVASAAEDVRNALNKTYRPQIQGLTELDANYSSKIDKINELEDGLVYKTGIHKGEIKDSFISKASKALKTGNDAQLAQLEEVMPGITKRLQVMKTIQDLSKPSFTASILEKGGVIGGLATGNLQVAATAFSAIILQNPEIAVPLMRAIGASAPLVKAVMANLARSLTIGAVANNAESTPQNQPSQPQDIGQSQQQTGLQIPENQPSNLSVPSTDSTTITPDLQALADKKHFDIKRAVKDGNSIKDIQTYLSNL